MSRKLLAKTAKYAKKILQNCKKNLRLCEKIALLLEWLSVFYYHKVDRTIFRISVNLSP